MGLISYSFLAPIIMPRVEKDSDSKNLKRYSVFFNRDTGEVKQEVTDEKGQREFPGKIDLKDSWTNPQGKMIHKAINKECPTCTAVFFEIDQEERKVTIAYLDKNFDLIIANTYN
jgi:hypothetical protein